MSLWISGVITAMIHIVVNEEKKGLTAFCFITLMSLWINAVITALIHGVATEEKKKTNGK